MDQELKIEQVPVGELIQAEYNPRIWEPEDRKHLSDSLDRFGFVQPIVANSAPNRRGVVIGGNFKLDIARGKGIPTVPVVWVNLPDIEKEKELNLRLNRNQGLFSRRLLSEFDENLLIDVGFKEFEYELDTQTGAGASSISFKAEPEEILEIRAALELAKNSDSFFQSGDKPKQIDSLMVIVKEWLADNKEKLQSDV